MSRRAKWCVFLVCVAALLAQQSSRALPQPTDALKFFKNFFVTGDYVVGGVGLWEQNSGTINISGAPAGAEVLAAFLYWQVVSPVNPDAAHVNAKFNHQSLYSPEGTPTPAGPLGKTLTSIGPSDSCPSSGGTEGGFLYTYRADVARFLDEEDGRQRINGSYLVELPNAGVATRTLGASLLIIYRDPDPAASLKSVVIYDGNYVKAQHAPLNQRVEGFYDPAPVTGKISYLVGSGQSYLGEILTGPFTQVTGPFSGGGFNGAVPIERQWDTVTLTTNPLAGTPTFFDTSILVQYPGGAEAPNDCLSIGAIVYRTAVNDTDNDGLLNRWEQSTNAAPLLDPRGERLPALGSLGANASVPDVFVEIGFMDAALPNTYGGLLKPAHSHLPSYEALSQVGDAFLAHGINLHFDVGDRYQGMDYIVATAAGANGGESLDETATQCTPGADDTPWTPDQPWNCQFDNHPGTVGWKSGFRLIRDEPLNGVTFDDCLGYETDGDQITTCGRRFDSSRRDMFHYVWFAHGLGIPKQTCIINYDEDAAFTPNPWDTNNPDSPLLGFPDVACQQGDPLFHVPVTNSGVGDFPGGDAMVTLGAFNDGSGLPIGTTYMQASTLMHELGHNFELRHGAQVQSGVVTPAPNCQPNYQSVMNYLFQLRGLFTNGSLPIIDYSGQTLASLDELFLPTGLYEDANAGVPPAYRTGWYAPRANVTFGTTAIKHCDGSPLLMTDPEMVRVDSLTIEYTHTTLAWNQSLDLQQAQDVNFDGRTDVGPVGGFNDWTHLQLNQVASRRNVGGWYWVLDPSTSMYAAFMGPMSMNVGHGDLGHGDLGHGDLGHGDLGHGDLGHGDLGHGDLGHGDLGHGDLGHGDLGHGDLGHGDLGHGDLGQGDLFLGIGGDPELSEVSLDLALASGLIGPPLDVKSFVRGTDGAAGTNSSVPLGYWVPMGEPTDCTMLTPAQCHRVRVDWKAPAAGVATGYRVFRKIEGTVPLEEITGDGYIQTAPGEFRLIDADELPDATRFTYLVTATFVVGASNTESGESDPATITGVNTAPVADAQAVGLLEDTDQNVTLTAVDPDTTVLTFSIVGSPSHGVLKNLSLPSLTYDPAVDYNSFDGAEGFTFKVHESSTWNNLGVDSVAAAVSLTVTPVNDAPSFTAGANQSVPQGAPAQSVANWATATSVGPPNEGAGFEGQTATFDITSNSNAALFTTAPAISPTGTLTYTPDPTKFGVATIKTKLHDSGGVLNGGADLSGEATFTITVVAAPPSGQRIKDITFEQGSLTGPNGFDFLDSAAVLETVARLKGIASVTVDSSSSSAYMEENFTGVDDFYWSFYVRINAFRSGSPRIALISNNDTSVGNLVLGTNGKLRLRVGTTNVGSESPALVAGQLYRIGMRQKKSTGGNGRLEAYLASGDAPFGAAFAQTTTGSWTTQANRIRLGATASAGVNMTFDDIRLDGLSMPPPSPPGPTLPTVSLVADSEVRANAPTATAGTATTFHTREGAGTAITRSYLKFTVTNVASPVVNAKLRIYASDANAAGFDVYSGADTPVWTEAGVNWNNAPALTTLRGTTGAFASKTWVEITLPTSMFAVTPGTQTFTFVLKGKNSVNTAYSSREGSNAPKLLLQVGP